MSERSGPSRALTISLLVCVLAIAFESLAVYTVMPVVAKELGGLDYYAWAFTLFIIGMMFATVAAGRLADRFGPGYPLAGGLVLFVVGLLAGGYAPSMSVLLVGRFVQGLGAGTLNLAAMVLVARLYAPVARARIMTWMSACWVLPAFFAPAIGAWLATHFGWQWVFRAVVPGVVIAGIVSARPVLRLGRSLSPAAPDPAVRPVPVWAAAAVALGAAGIQLAGQHLELASLASLAVAVVLLAVSLPRLMPRRHGSGRDLWTVIGVRLLAAGAFFGAESFTPLMLTETRGLDTLAAGTALTVGSVGWTIGSWLQARPWITLRRDRLLQLGGVVLCGGVCAMALGAYLATVPLVVMALAWTCCGLGMGLIVPVTTLTTIQLSGDAEQGRNNSSLQVGEALGNSLFSGLAGTIFAAVHASWPVSSTFGAVIGAMAGVGLALVILTMRLGPLANEASAPA
ncbi:MFS transporter [Propionicicella superfundia]|uniref:MFS transporter n=1 Tax=Propionicicella superfundia TaxID=348582 RepID=UPI000420A39B|nr:MFS transporter [Propionicicella superfundia]